MKQNLKKFGAWVNRNRYNLANAGIVIGTFSFVGWVIKAAYKAEADAINEYNAMVAAEMEHDTAVKAFVVDQLNNGKTVFTLEPDTFLVLDKDAPREIVVI